MVGMVPSGNGASDVQVVGLGGLVAIGRWRESRPLGVLAVAIALRIWVPNEAGEVKPVPLEKLRWDGSRKLPAEIPPSGPETPLSVHFQRRFVPLRCLAEDLGDSTIKGYYDALRYGIQIGGDVPIGDLDDVWVARVRAGLAEATYRRSRFAGRVRKIAPATAEKHLRQLRALLRSLGPDGEGILTRVPKIRLRRERRRPKECYSVDELRAIVRSAERTASKGLPPKFWRACYGVLFYSGLRRRAALSIGLQDLRRDDAGLYFDVDGELNAKTGKPLWLPCHESLAAVLSELERAGYVGRRLIPWPHSGDYLLRVHKRICQDAGVAHANTDLHGIRRTLLNTAAFSAFDAAMRTAAAFGQHSDVRITAESYVSPAGLLAEIVPTLPRLWD